MPGYEVKPETRLMGWMVDGGWGLMLSLLAYVRSLVLSARCSSRWVATANVAKRGDQVGN